MCIFHLTIYRILLCKCVFVSSMAKPSCSLWSVCTASICTNCSPAPEPPLLPVIVRSLQINSLLLTWKTTCGRLVKKVNALDWDTVQKQQHYLFIFIYLHIPYTSQLSAENENTHIGCPFVAVKGQQSSCMFNLQLNILGLLFDFQALF